MLRLILVAGVLLTTLGCKTCTEIKVAYHHDDVSVEAVIR